MKTQTHLKIKHSLGERIFTVVNAAVFGLFALICIYPIYYILINSISSNDAVIRGEVMLWPKGIHFRNYIDIFRLKGIGEATLYSVARTVIGTITGVMSSMIMGYAVTKKEYWHRKFWYRFMIVTMYFGAGMIPCYLNIINLGLINTFWVYIIPTLTSSYHMILCKTFIESIPDSLEEAAYMDGAGYFVRFTRVVLPLCKPIMATCAIYTAVGQWNAYMDTLMYQTQGKYRTLQYILYRYLNEANAVAALIENGAIDAATVQMAIVPKSVQFTITAITVIPILLVYPAFQKHFAKGMMIGAVKG